ncbi:MAG TPA: hypothetical protein PK437_03575 [Thiobacillaceae bacterium]|nr:hypothetical protein [Thiobacillaceae bacterium]
MNPRSLWRLALLAACWVWPWPAPADALRIEALSLEPGAGWTRGGADQEKEDDVYILDHPGDAGVGLQVMLMRRAPLVKGDSEAYYERLTRYWRATYGKSVLIDWLELGGVKWRYLRRPARENGLGLFQLYTVHEGRAYGLLVFVPGTATTLSVPARALLEGLRFDGEGQAPRWMKARTYRLVLSGDALEAVASAEAARQGGDGLLTGYGLNYGENSVEWFLEGYQWKTLDGRVDKLAWATRGRLVVEPPAELGSQGVWTLRLILPDGEANLAARLVVHDLCGDLGEVRDALDRLNRGTRGAMERRAAACRGPGPVASGDKLKGLSGETATATWTLAPGVGEGVSVRLVEAIVEATPERVLPGDGLLQRARLFYAYEPR